jgi:hypothetical protein
MRSWRIWLVVFGWLSALSPGHAQMSELEQSNKALAQLSLNDKRELQTRLSLLGYFDGIAGETVGRRLFGSFQAFQAASGFPATGVLTQQDYDLITRNGMQVQTELGMAVVTHFANKLRLQIPFGVTPEKTSTARGVAYESFDKRLSIDVSYFAYREGGFDRLFKRLSTSSDGRTVRSKLLQSGMFALIGDANGRDFYVRALADDDGAFILTISWSNASFPAGRSIAIGIANSMVFDPNALPADPAIAAGNGASNSDAMGGPFEPVPNTTLSQNDVPIPDGTNGEGASPKGDLSRYLNFTVPLGESGARKQ